MIRRFRSPKRVVLKYITKHSLRSSIVVGFIIGIYMISKASSYLKTYQTVAARQKIAESLGANVGIEAILGTAHQIETVAGYVAWNFLCLIAAGGAVWAIFMATKTFRGDEDAGRWELFMAGQTTARRATVQALTGLGVGLILVYALIVIAILSIGKLPGVHFTASASIFFALALIAGAVEFMAFGALASQLMPVRSRALGLSAIVFGVCYAMRLIGDTTSAHWLLVLSPLGWIEKLQPMYNSQPVWLIPIGCFAALACILTVFFAGQRDLGEGILSDQSVKKPHYLLLRSPFTASFRLNRASTIGWIVSIVIFAFVYGQLAKGAIVNALSQSTAVMHAFDRLAQSDASRMISSASFLSIAYLLIMLLAMFYVATAIGRLRDDEAKGYLDNFLVRPYSRLRWLSGRATLIFLVLFVIGVCSSVAVWVGEASQHAGLPYHILLQASANALTPALLILGIGICVFGCVPRLTGILTYSIIAWSFLLIMLSAGLVLNHWFLDSSILHHINFAPAANPDWSTDIKMICLAILLGCIGGFVFNRRDIQSE